MQAVTVRLPTSGDAPPKWGLGYLVVTNWDSYARSVFEHQAYLKQGTATRITRSTKTITYEVGRCFIYLVHNFGTYEGILRFERARA